MLWISYIAGHHLPLLHPNRRGEDTCSVAATRHRAFGAWHLYRLWHAHIEGVLAVLRAQPHTGHNIHEHRTGGGVWHADAGMVTVQTHDAVCLALCGTICPGCLYYNYTAFSSLRAIARTMFGHRGYRFTNICNVVSRQNLIRACALSAKHLRALSILSLYRLTPRLLNAARLRHRPFLTRALPASSASTSFAPRATYRRPTHIS